MIGHILYAESFPTAKSSDFEMIEWMYTPYVLSVGIQSNSKTEVDDHTKETKFYSIYNPAVSDTASHTSADDSSDDAQKIDLCHNPPPYSVARVEFPSDIFLTPDWERMVNERNYLTFNVLSNSKDGPVMAKTGLSWGNVWTGLFPP
jgi:hypothetical protein